MRGQIREKRMASKGENSEPKPNTMERALDTIRKQYVEEHGEEPSDEFIEEARRRIILGVARQDREAHREIYDALADE
jgi:hypothetical protein